MEFSTQLTERVAVLRDSRRLRWAAGIALGVVVLLLGVAHVVLNSDATRASVREKALARLQQRLGPVVLGDRVEISWSGEARLGPLAIPAGPQLPPLLSVDEIRVRASWLGLLHGAVEASRVTLSGLTLRVDDRGERLHAFEAQLPEKKHDAPSGAPASESKLPLLVVDDARVVVDRSSELEPLQLGPFDVQAQLGRENGGRTVDMRLRAGRGNARLRGVLDAKSGSRLTATADDLPLAQLVPGGAGAPLEVRTGLLSGKLELTAEPGAEALTAEVDADVRELVIAGPRVADEPVGPAQAYFAGKVKLDRAQAQITTEDAKLFLGPARVEIPFEATLELRPELRFDVDVRLGPINLQQLVASLPPQLAPPQGESRDLANAGEPGGSGRQLMAPPHFDGEIRAEIRASGPVRRPDSWTVGVRMDVSDLKAKARSTEFELREPFVYRPRDAAGVERVFAVGPKNPSYVPLDELPAIVPAAVITSEDGNFFSHNGFDFDEIRDSLATAAEGARLRGGSTLTQQLVKNLYLSRERTLQRKLREALITVQFEAALPKSRILEIYLNLIEWGPGVYGIGEAAHYYFGVDARHLSAKQAVFLATIIPNPVKYSVYFRKGATSRNWDDHMAHLIEKLHERGNLDDAQFEKALSDGLGFRPATPATAKR